MSEAIAVLCTVGAGILALGIAWGDLRARLTRIEKLIGNGHEPAFLPREEARLLHEAIIDRIERLEARR